MFGFQHYLVVLCIGAPLWPLTDFAGERTKALWALLFIPYFWNEKLSLYMYNIIYKTSTKLDQIMSLGSKQTTP